MAYNKEEPLVSIVCMAYCHSKYIKKTIESFKLQDYTNVEFIIVDDCSPDDTYKIALETANSDSRFRIYRNNENIGALRNSKYSLSLALGDYIGFCECDDYFIHPNKISMQVEMLKNDTFSMVFTGSVDLDESGNVLSLNTYGKTTKNFSFPKTVRIGGNLCSTSSTLYKRFVTDSLPSDFFSYPVGDYPLQVIASSLGTIGYLPIIGSAYRRLSEVSWSVSMRNSDRYLTNHIATLRMLNSIYNFCGGKYRYSFLYAKLKYCYFLSISNVVSCRKRLLYLMKSGFPALIFIPFTIISPLFRLLNYTRRIVLERKRKRNFYDKI